MQGRDGGLIIHFGLQESCLGKGNTSLSIENEEHVFGAQLGFALPSLYQQLLLQISDGGFGCSTSS